MGKMAGDKKHNRVKLAKKAEALLDELRETAMVLPEEDIDFLVRQAKVFREERAVEKATLDLEARYRETGTGGDGRAWTGKREGASGGKDAASAEAVCRQEPVHIVRSASGSVNLVIRGEFKLLAGDELDRIVKIAIAPGTEAEKALALWRWLDRERRDILIDGGMADERSPLLIETLRYLGTTFAGMKSKDSAR